MLNTEDNRYYYPDGTGIKTGFTNAAGNCFVGAASRNGVNLISVVFYSGDRGRYADTIKMMEYGFSQYVGITPTELYAMNPITIDTNRFSLQDSNLGRLTLYARPMDTAENATLIVNRNELDMLMRNFRRMCIIEYTRDFSAPVAYGEVFGTMTYVPGNGSPVEYQLIASRAINARENPPKTIAQIEAETYADPNPFPPFSVEIMLLLSWPFIALFLAVYFPIRLYKRRKTTHAKVPPPISRRYK